MKSTDFDKQLKKAIEGVDGAHLRKLGDKVLMILKGMVIAIKMIVSSKRSFHCRLFLKTKKNPFINYAYEKYNGP